MSQEPLPHGRRVSLRTREMLDAITTCEHCGCKLGLCECDNESTVLLDQFVDSVNEEQTEWTV